MFDILFQSDDHDVRHAEDGMARVPADARRLEFIEAAVTVIAESGMRGATTRRIAEAAHAPLASLHYRFHTKEDLFFSVFEYMSTSMVEMQVDVVPTRDDLATTAVQLIESVRDWSLANPKYTKVQFDLALWAAQQPGLGARIYKVFLDAFTNVLAGAVGPGVDRAAVESIARLITSVLDGLSLQWVSDADEERFRADIARACAMVSAYIVSLEIPAVAATAS
ncbi:MAG: TetR family transcriptional regulator [Nocardioidaceae bacterium]|nr:TetR family transcriptional regulator [Nocardioidaceae bacterium]